MLACENKDGVKEIKSIKKYGVAECEIKNVAWWDGNVAGNPRLWRLSVWQENDTKIRPELYTLPKNVKERCLAIRSVFK